MYHTQLEKLLNSKQLLTPWNQWNVTTNDVVRKLTQQQLQILSDHLIRLSEQFKKLSTVKNPEEWIELQKECINEYFFSCSNNFQKSLHALFQNIEDLSNVGNNIRHSAMDTAKKASHVASDPLKKLKKTKRHHKAR